MSLSDERTDRVYREPLGWPVPVKPTTPVAVVTDLRAMLADRRRRHARQHPKAGT